MPFTLSHSIAGIMLHKVSCQRLSLSALIIGAMMPDTEYLLRMKMYGVFGHTFLGVLLFGLPLGLLFFILFQKIIKTPLVLNLPRYLSTRFTPFLDQSCSQEKSLFPIELQNIKGFIIILISLSLGILSHIIWDDFTHQTGFFVINISLLQQDIRLFGTAFPFYKILQLMSSLLGLLAVSLWIYLLPKQETSKFPNKTKCHYQRLFTLLTLFIITIRLSISFTLQYGHLIVIILSASFLSLFLTSLIWRVQNRNY